MFEPTSRYHGLPIRTLTVTGPGGIPREIRLVARRFLPAAVHGPPSLTHRVVQGDRLDLLAAQYLGDPTQFWRIADANEGLSPEELTAFPGRRLVIPTPPFS